MTTIRATGHPEIRATHDKTWELTPDTELTARATCVLGVGAVTEGGPLAGPVELRIGAGGHSATVRAVGNPSWVPGGPAVIRRSPLRLPGTLATDADLSAADLPRDLAARLTDPATEVLVEVSAVDDPGTVVLLHATGPSPRLSAELAAADTVLAEDAGARALLARLTAAPARAVPADRIGRIFVLATEDLPGRTVRHLLGGPTEVIGLPPAWPPRPPPPPPPRCTSPCPPANPPTPCAPPPGRQGGAPRRRRHRGQGARRRPRSRHPHPRGGHRALRRERAPALGRAGHPAAARPRRVLDLPRPGPQPGPGPVAAQADLRPARPGVPAKSIAQTLAELPGFTRRTAYDAVQQLKDLGS